MVRISYQSMNGQLVAHGPGNPTAGQRVKRTHSERTHRKIFRQDGSVAGVEDREVVTLDTDGEAYNLCDARRVTRMPATIWGRFWDAVRRCALVLFDCAAILTGSLLAYTLAYACTSSTGWGMAGIGAFLLYCTWLRVNV